MARTQTRKPAPAKPAPAARPVATDAATDAVISTLGWIGYKLVLAIPLVGLILYFVWAFEKGDGNLTRRNYCRASLILIAAGIVFSIIFGLIISTMYMDIYEMILDM